MLATYTARGSDSPTDARAMATYAEPYRRLGRRLLREFWSGLVMAVPVAVAVAAVLPYQKLTTALMNEHQQLRQAELKALDGTWALAGRERQGQAVSREQLPKEALVIQGGKYTWRADQGEEKGTVEVYPFRRPGNIILTTEGGPHPGSGTGA